MFARWLVSSVDVVNSRLLVDVSGREGCAVATYASVGSVRLQGCVLDAGVLLGAEGVIVDEG